MQNNPNEETGGMPSPQSGEHSTSDTRQVDPTYKELASPGATDSSGSPLAAFGAPSTQPNVQVGAAPAPSVSQPASAPSIPPSEYIPPSQLSSPNGGAPWPAQLNASSPVGPAGYIPPVLPPGYTMPPAPQPGYIPATPPPGYIPVTPQPGYVPPTPQPGYVPAVAQPGYPPGYMPPTPPRRRPGWLAITSVVLAVLLLLTVFLVSILRNTSGTTPASPTPGTQNTQVAQNATPTAPGHPTSAFTPAPCPFPVGGGLTEGQQVSCGYVTVPQNRAVSNGGQVKLAVAIFKAQQYMTTPDPAPVLRLDGGPGGPSLDNLARFVSSANYGSLIFDHDEIMFDQRGTGYSTPSLKCTELIALQYSTTDVGAQTYEKQAQTCHDRLVSQGIDLNGFNSIQNAADVNDVIHALGYKQMTLYGVSYGTRLALTVMRLYPDVVHAAVLDSVYPPNHNRNDLPSDAQRVFDVLFQGCAKDANCNAKYPKLQSVFYNLVDTLNAHPVSFHTVDLSTNNAYTVPLSGNDLVSWLFSSLYVTSFIKLLPQTIFQIRDHNYTQLSEIYSAVGFDSTFSDGMFYSAECSEDWPFLTQQDITASLQGITPQIGAVFGQDEKQEFAVCQSWKVQQVTGAQKQPVVSNVPTLVLSGEYDPITPPSNGQETAKNLSHSYFFIFPGQGHGQEYSSACSNSIINAFENNPDQQPSNACIAQMSEPAFQ